MISGLIDGRYQLISEIGFGGFSRVFLAYDTFREMNVAIKFLETTTADENDKHYRMFKQEATTMAIIRNNNVCRFYAMGLYEQHPYFVMEHIKGEDLSSIINKKVYLMTDEIYLYLMQILNGLEAIHNANILHRDIKPRNIMLKSDGKIVLLDFGTAYITAENENIFENDKGTAIGTMQYMAPELFTGEKKEGSPQSDIYALGISIYEMCTGKVPFPMKKSGDKRADVRDIYEKHLNAPIPDVRIINPSIPDSFNGIIQKCCAKNAEDRYININEIRIDLEKAYEEYKKPPLRKKKGLFERLFKKDS